MIDLGPEGAKEGGMVITEGPPEKIARCKESHTEGILKEAFKRGRGFIAKITFFSPPFFKGRSGGLESVFKSPLSLPL